MARAARSMSLIIRPVPGPSSMSGTGAGAPICPQTSAVHRPRSSPNIWLISGAVTKSPAMPIGSRVV